MEFSADDLIAAIEGAYGEEAQEQALDEAERLGLLEMWANEQAAAGQEDYTRAIGEELRRVEGMVGRPLTRAEEDQMLNSVGTQDFEDQVVPNLAERFGAELKGRVNDDKGRVAMSAERAEEQFDFSDGWARPREETPAPAPAPAEPAPPDGGQEE